MTQKAYVVPLRDLDDGPKTLRQEVTDAWLSQQLADTDVMPAGRGDGAVDITLTKNGRDVLVRGRLAVTVQVPCARTLDPAVYRVTPEVFLLLGPRTGADAAGPRRKAADGPRAGARDSSSKDTAGKAPAGKAPAGKAPLGKAASSKVGREARPAKGTSENWDDDGLLDAEDAARDTYSGDQVVLDDFLREFILLEIPMVPLREDLRKAPFEATPSPPGSPSAGDSSRSESDLARSNPDKSDPDRPEGLDPRLSPLIALKARLEKKE